MVELKIVKSKGSNKEFQDLVAKLDKFLKHTDGEDHAFYNQFNSSVNLEHVALGYLQGVCIACGAFKPFDSSTVEVKRMYVDENFRGKSYAKQILFFLENWAKELGYGRAVLETGKRQRAAVAFYTSMNYHVIPNYGQYKEMVNSICYSKNLVGSLE